MCRQWNRRGQGSRHWYCRRRGRRHPLQKRQTRPESAHRRLDGFPNNKLGSTCEREGSRRRLTSLHKGSTTWDEVSTLGRYPCLLNAEPSSLHSEQSLYTSCFKFKRTATYARHGAVPKWLREQSGKLRCGGSNPPGASIIFSKAFQ